MAPLSGTQAIRARANRTLYMHSVSSLSVDFSRRRPRGASKPTVGRTLCCVVCVEGGGGGMGVGTHWVSERRPRLQYSYSRAVRP